MVSPLLIAAAGLLTAAVIAAVLWPVWRGGQRRLFVATLLPALLLAPVLYLLIGTPQALDAQARQAPRDLADGVSRLQQALREDPQRADGWALLARSQLELGQPEQALQAYERALQLNPSDAVLLVEAAQAQAQADPARRFDDRAMAWLQQARTLAPNNERSSWLLGIGLRQRGQNREAAELWQALLPQLDPGTARALSEQIAIARNEAGLPPLESPPATSAKALHVHVMLDPDFAARASLAADSSIFVIARVPGGPPMPVAVEKHRLQDLPLQVLLDDADSPMPTQRLSELDEVEVFARLSASGNPMRQPDDLESPPQRIRLPAAAPVQLVLGSP